MLRTSTHQPATNAPAPAREQASAPTVAEAWGARTSWGGHDQSHVPPVAGSAAQLQAIAREWPTLGYIGLRMKGQSGEAFEPERRTLVAPGSVGEFARALAWLRRANLSPTKGRGHSSYVLKHMAANDGWGFIGSGPFIAACIAAGYAVTPSPSPGSPNAVVGLKLPRKRR